MVMKNERGLKIQFYFSLCFAGTPQRPLADNEKEKSEKEKEFFFSGGGGDFPSYLLFYAHLPVQPPKSLDCNTLILLQRQKLD